MLREQYIATAGDEGANVRVINASWITQGEPGPGLREAVEAARDADILIVAAAGNGSAFRRPVNIDESPAYPASYSFDAGELDNIIGRYRHGRERPTCFPLQFRPCFGRPGGPGDRHLQHLARRQLRVPQWHQHGDTLCERRSGAGLVDASVRFDGSKKSATQSSRDSTLSPIPWIKARLPLAAGSTLMGH